MAGAWEQVRSIFRKPSDLVDELGSTLSAVIAACFCASPVMLAVAAILLFASLVTEFARL